MILKSLFLILISLFTFSAPVSNVVPQEHNAIVYTVEESPQVLQTSAKVNYVVANNYQRLTDPTYDNAMVNDLWEGLQLTVGKVIDFMVTLFNGVVKVFYNSEATTTNKLTVVGWLTLIGLGFAMFYAGLRFIRSLISRMRGR